MQRFQRNQKWWWTLWLWGMEISLVNSFMMIRQYCKLKGVRQPFQHHEFNELIGRDHLDPINEWPKRMKGKRTTAAGKRKRPPTTRKQAPRFTSDTLCHIKGVLNKRLETSLNHLHVPSTGDINDSKKGNFIVCQLHRWPKREKYVLRNNKESTYIAPIPAGA